MTNRFFTAIALSVVLSWATTALADTPADLAARTVQAVKPSPKWERVEVATAQKDMYSIYIWYRQRPAGFAEVERDTKAVARAMLKTLVDAGQKPAEDWISVFVRGGEKVTGETGRPLSRVFGRTMYDFNNDSLTFRRGN